ncbi:MAG: coproporphyrinogen-III oxidase family protein, partial [Anaerolineales bacterium]|nr:hypothetical protein [Anaerolineales bacterium]MDW8446048.1 coproporphyrinogen-III oxidase family protein [Anaerolineales bacterium]
ALRAVEFARVAGIDNLNLDLIYGLPSQSLRSWENSLKVALSLGVEHLSLYSLTVEEGTLLDRWVRSGVLPYPEENFAADCYELARELLANAGYLHYEISNWALLRSGEEIPVCRHNLQYWKNQEYFGLGAGAHGFLGGYRLANVSHPQQYIERIRSATVCSFPFSPAVQECHCVTPEEEMRDTVLLGLRLVHEGVGEADFFRRFGKSLLEVFPKEIARLTKKGLVEWVETDQRRLRLTRFGQLLGNQAFVEFI